MNIYGRAQITSKAKVCSFFIEEILSAPEELELFCKVLIIESFLEKH